MAPAVGPPAPAQLPFYDVCQFFDSIAAAPQGRKAKLLAGFKRQCVRPGTPDIFQIYRLLLPKVDEQRGNYSLKENTLAKTLAMACGLDTQRNVKAQRAIKWRDGGGGGKVVGNFAPTMEEYLFKDHCGRTDNNKIDAKELTVGRLNELLDALVQAEFGKPKQRVLSQLMQLTTPRMMRWVTALIIKELKIGLTEVRVLRDLHEDAEHLYNLTTSLLAVCTQLNDPTKRLPRKDLEPGSAARPMLATVAKTAEYVFARLKGRPFIVETKFDGERMQLHRMGSEVQFYSRAGHEHGVKSHYNILADIVQQQVLSEQCILDGELIVWNLKTKCFEPFGTLKCAILAARDKKSADEAIECDSHEIKQINDPEWEVPLVRDLQIVYVAFDVLYVNEGSIINRPLLERHGALKDIVRPVPEGIPLGNMTARIVPLLPDKPFLDSEKPASRTCTTVEEIQLAVEAAAEVKEEGIVVKDTTSTWKMNDRSAAWFKIKPDYMKNSEIDAVVVGCHYGTGRRGGQLSEFLLALADGQRSPTPPTEFVTFCRVGTGCSDAERKAIEEQLRPHLVKTRPRWLKATGQAKERPDLYVGNISKSIVFQIKGDVRLINSKVFRTRYSMRFPTVERIRHDKSPLDVQTEEELVQMVEQGVEKREASGGGRERMQSDRQQGRRAATLRLRPRDCASEAEEEGAKRQATGGKGGRRKRFGASVEKRKPPAAAPWRKGVVLDQFAPTDVSDIKVESDALAGVTIAFADYGPRGKPDLESLVTRLGGKVVQSYKPAEEEADSERRQEVRFMVSAAPQGARYGAHVAKDRDVVSLEWLEEVEEAGRAAPLRPRHYLHLSVATLGAMGDVISRYGDPFYDDVEAADVRTILQSRMRLADIDATELASAFAQPEAGLHAGPARRDPGSHSPEADRLAVMRSVAAEMSATAGDGVAGSGPPLLGCIVAVAAPGLTGAAGSAANGRGAANQAPHAAVHSGGCGADDAVARLTASVVRQTRTQVRLRGGRVAAAVDSSTTHLLLARCDGPSPTAAKVLAAVRDGAGGGAGLAAMRDGLQSGRLRVVDSRWAADSIEAGVQLLEGDFPPRIAGAADGSGWPADAEWWPWSEFGVPATPSATPEKAKPKRAQRGKSRSRQSPIEKGPTARARALGAGRGRGRGRIAGGKRQRPAASSSDGSSGGDTGSGAASGGAGAVPDAATRRPRRAAATRAAAATAQVAAGSDEASDSDVVPAAAAMRRRTRRKVVIEDGDEDETELLQPPPPPPHGAAVSVGGGPPASKPRSTMLQALMSHTSSRPAATVSHSATDAAGSSAGGTGLSHQAAAGSPAEAAAGAAPAGGAAADTSAGGRHSGSGPSSPWRSSGRPPALSLKERLKALNVVKER